MPFLPYKLLAQSKIAALPELCLLGKNTFNNWSRGLWAKFHELFFNPSLDTEFGPAGKGEGTEQAIIRKPIIYKSGVAGTMGGGGGMKKRVFNHSQDKMK